METATQNDFGMVWMSSPNHMLMPSSSGMPPLPQDMLQLDTSSSQMDSSYYTMAVPPPFDSVAGQPMEMDGFLMMDEYEPEFCDEPPKFMTAATQTATGPTRKIKPVKHPGLKLQTPIAYKCDTDPSVIPIQKDGMAICEKCGAIGVKHSFYTRHRKFCSLACARGSLDNKDEEMDDENSNSNLMNYKFPNGIDIKDEEYITKEPTTLNLQSSTLHTVSSSSCVSHFPSPNLVLPLDEPTLPVPSKRVQQELANSYEWIDQLFDEDFMAAPVSCFKHVPMSDCWDNVTIGMKVEVENRDCDSFSDSFPDSFWVATVRKVAGYNALLRYEGFGESDFLDFWSSLCSNSVHPVGWCATRGKPLIPPKSIEHKYLDWKEFLVERLTGARTLPSNFYSKVAESLRSRFRVGLNVEVVDKARISQVCLAVVKKIVGKRLHVEYYNAKRDDNGFWCHEDSPLIHPVGWAYRVGHLIDAPYEYQERCESGLIDTDDATEELFTAPQQSAVANLHVNVQKNGFKEGMKLEAVDPLNLSSICVATVMKVLKDNYIMVRIDTYAPDATGWDWFCYHISSPCIFPPGFCQKNSITLTPPKDYDQQMFSWSDYITSTNSVMAPESLFDKPIPNHGFVVGMRLEVADLMTPKLVCVATISRVVGRLLKVHFDGWEDEYDQWLDCESPDIYPVGWCQLVGHKLEGPRVQPVQPVVPSGRKFRKRKIKGKTKKCAETSTNNDENINIENRLQSINANGSSHEESKSPPSSKDEPERSIEINGPELCLQPDCTTTPLKPCSTATTTTSNCNNITSTKYIPRLTEVSASGGTTLNPLEWSEEDVVEFLNRNDCGTYADAFRKKGIDGSLLLSLTEEQILELTNVKIGPTLKISEIIQQLKIKSNKSMYKKKI